MMKPTWWKRISMIAGVGVLALASSGAWQVRSAEPARLQQPGQYYGSATCKGCHNVPAASPAPIPGTKDFIRLDEWTIWEADDKHSIAYTNLKTERGQRMATLLHVADVTKPEVGCLGCHSASAGEVANRNPQGAAYDPSEGVSCENCHGPYSGWAAEHLTPKFRTLPAADWAKVGFTEMRTPEGKAEKCLSCHIGNVEEGKVVTHEMYAAGHPPLPSIEVATFANAIPRHWWLHAERRDEKIKKALGYEEGQLEQTKLAIVGAAVALRTSLKLLADEARTPEKTGAPGQEWPDYARFDCWSCHHDLKRDGWRQARGYKDGPPGRVPVNEWPLALVELGIDRLILEDKAAEALRLDLRGHEMALRDQVNIRPFGRKVDVAEQAEAYAKWTDVLIKRLGASKFDKGVAMTLLRKLVERAETSTPDYDSARIVAWTIKLLVDELGVALPRRAEIVAIVDKLDAGLKLNLPSGRFYKIEDEIGKALNVIGDYDPPTFRAQLHELLALLPPQ